MQVGTSMNISAESRYYTAEGDQLGRGPLPPEVGKETKYWALVTISNSTSVVGNPQFRAVLPPPVTWTGRSSVSHGSDLSYSETTRTVSWSHNALGRNQATGLYMELAYTPSPSDVGKSLPLLEQITITGTDAYIDTPLRASAANIDTSLSTDTRAQQRGVLVR